MKLYERRGEKLDTFHYPMNVFLSFPTPLLISRDIFLELGKLQSDLKIEYKDIRSLDVCIFQ